MPPPQPPDVALLRRVLDGLRRLQTDPPADLAVQQPSPAPWTDPQPFEGERPPLETRVPGTSPAGGPDDSTAPQDPELAPDPAEDALSAPTPPHPRPPMPTRRSSVPGGPGFLGAVGMTMPATDEHAPPYSVDKTHIVSIS